MPLTLTSDARADLILCAGILGADHGRFTFHNGDDIDDDGFNRDAERTLDDIVEMSGLYGAIIPPSTLAMVRRTYRGDFTAAYRDAERTVCGLAS